MNVSSTSSTDKVSENNSQINSKQNDNDEKVSFSEEYNQLLAQNGLINPELQPQLLNTANSQGAFSELSGQIQSFFPSFNYNKLTISKDDALFFSELVEKTDFIVSEKADGSSFQAELFKVVNNSQSQNLKSAEVSKSLMNMIEEAYKTQKPTRIDFDNNVSVILKISKEGKVSAEFIPGDKAVEKYLRDNIGYLKDRFEEQNLDYGDIMYKPYKNNSKQQRNNRNNGGSNNE